MLRKSLLNAIADKVLVITLPESKERQEAVRKNFHDARIEFEFFPGVRPDPDSIRWSEMRMLEAYSKPHYLRTSYVVGAVGCKRAGIAAFEEVIKRGWNTALICQDDCEWLPSVSKLARIWKQVPPDWDMVYFSGADEVPSEQISPAVRRLRGARLCTAILFRRSFIEDILPRLRTWDAELDVFLDYIHPYYKAYAVDPYPAQQAPGYSWIFGAPRSVNNIRLVSLP